MSVPYLQAGGLQVGCPCGPLYKPFSSLSRLTFVQAVSQVSETSLNRAVNPKNSITVHNVVLHKMLICKDTRWY